MHMTTSSAMARSIPPQASIPAAIYCSWEKPMPSNATTSGSQEEEEGFLFHGGNSTGLFSIILLLANTLHLMIVTITITIMKRPNHLKKD